MLPQYNSFMETAKDAVFQSLAYILGYDLEKNPEIAEEAIRFSWPTGSGSQAFAATPTTDICYIRMTAVNKEGDGYINTNYSLGGSGKPLNTEMNMHISLRADYIFYGPNAHEHATRLYMMINSYEVRQILASASMAPIPHEELPTAMAELVDGNWYERFDAGINFYMLVRYNGTVNALLEAPDIVTEINE